MSTLDPRGGLPWGIPSHTTGNHPFLHLLEHQKEISLRAFQNRQTVPEVKAHESCWERRVIAVAADPDRPPIKRASGKQRAFWMFLLKINILFHRDRGPLSFPVFQPSFGRILWAHGQLPLRPAPDILESQPPPEFKILRVVKTAEGLRHKSWAPQTSSLPRTGPTNTPRCSITAGEGENHSSDLQGLSWGEG